jgi:hypothetical protein
VKLREIAPSVRLAAGFVIGLFSAARPAAACPICFGDPNSPITKSAELGVWFLLAVIVIVEVAFAVFFFVYLRRRARAFRDPVPRAALRLVKKGVL